MWCSVLFRPFRAPLLGGQLYPGRRCALPWADMFWPLRGEFCGGPFGASFVQPCQFTALPFGASIVPVLSGRISRRLVWGEFVSAPSVHGVSLRGGVDCSAPARSTLFRPCNERRLTCYRLLVERAPTCYRPLVERPPPCYRALGERPRTCHAFGAELSARRASTQEPRAERSGASRAAPL